MIQDKTEDLVVQYLYVKSWQFAEKLREEQFQGLPNQGRVYRSLYNTRTKSWRMILDQDSGIYVPKLIQQEPSEEAAYTCDMVQVTKENLLDLKLVEEDLDQILHWIETKNQDLAPQPIPAALLQALVLHTRPMEEHDFVAYAVDTISELYNVNTIHAEIITELSDLLYDKNVEEVPNLSEMSLDPKHGLGINVSRAIDCLKKYSSNNRRTNEDRNDLLMAIIHLITELERRSINELDEE